jgi:hypothetical protein
MDQLEPFGGIGYLCAFSIDPRGGPLIYGLGAQAGPRQQPGVTLEKEKNMPERRLKPAFSPSQWTF